MREILEIIREEKFDMDRAKLLFYREGSQTEQIQICLEQPQMYEGSFVLQAPEGRITYGYVSASDSRMECLNSRFSGTEEIAFRFHGEHLEPGEQVKGYFLIRSNQGETMLPYEISAEEKKVYSSEGRIRNLIDFGNLARNNWQEALGIFYTKEFAGLVCEKEPQVYQAYRGLAAGGKNEHNLDQFLILTGRKQRMSYFVEDSLLSLSDPTEVTEIHLGIARSGWGYTCLDVEVEGNFLFAEKEVITDDDFLGNRYKLPLYIDSERLHAGRNFGTVSLKDNDISVQVPVEVYCTGEVLPGREIRREKRKNDCKLISIYQAFRLKELNQADWLNDTDQLVQRMMSLDEGDVAAKLFFAQILLTAGQNNEAGWILEHVGSEMRGDPDLEAYYMYLASLLRGDEAYTRQVAERIERIYRERGETWRTAWLLLYVSREYERNISAKWSFLETQFLHGCRSPILYLEAVLLLNRNPALLRRLDRFEQQVLHYGNRKGVLSEELSEQVYYLAGRVKEFSGLLYGILVSSYERTQDERVLKEICTLLIKGNRVGRRYSRWFLLAVETGIKLTNLYEYYMMSLDLEADNEIPRIVLLYFSYQSNLDHAHAAYLYSYIAARYEEIPDIFESYRARMTAFVKEQLRRERMSAHMDRLYHMFLREDMVQKQNAAAVLKILFSYQMKVPGSFIRRAYIYQNGVEAPQAYSVHTDTVWLPVYGRECSLVWEDDRGNRYHAGAVLGAAPELAEHPIVKRAAVYVNDNPYLDLYLYEAAGYKREETPSEETGTADTEYLNRLLRLWNGTQVCEQICREAAVRVMKYYYQIGDKANLAEFLGRLSPERMTRREAAEVIKYMVYCRMDDRAYEWMMMFSPLSVDSKISASLLSAMVRRDEYTAEETLLKFAFETFEKGKYTREILRYLTMHYEGRAYDMYQIWKAAYACEIDIREFGERLLIQMLFTGDYVEEQGEIFRKYLKDLPDEEVVMAYLIRRSYAYYLDGYTPDSVCVQEILKAYGEQSESEIQLPLICRLACLLYYAKVDIVSEPERDRLLSGMLKELLQQGIHLSWFGLYKDLNVDLSVLRDKTILEYHGREDRPVKLRYMPRGDSVWRISNMIPVCRNVYFAEQILFFGEDVPYEIVEQNDVGEQVVQSGVLKVDAVCRQEAAPQDAVCRYDMINQLAEASALRKDKEFEELLEEYLKKDFMNSQLFRIR